MPVKIIVVSDPEIITSLPLEKVMYFLGLLQDEGVSTFVIKIGKATEKEIELLNLRGFEGKVYSGLQEEELPSLLLHLAEYNGSSPDEMSLLGTSDEVMKFKGYVSKVGYGEANVVFSEFVEHVLQSK